LFFFDSPELERGKKGGWIPPHQLINLVLLFDVVFPWPAPMVMVRQADQCCAGFVQQDNSFPLAGCGNRPYSDFPVIVQDLFAKGYHLLPHYCGVKTPSLLLFPVFSVEQVVPLHVQQGSSASHQGHPDIAGTDVYDKVSFLLCCHHACHGLIRCFIKKCKQGLVQNLDVVVFHFMGGTRNMWGCQYPWMTDQLVIQSIRWLMVTDIQDSAPDAVVFQGFQ